VSGVETTAVKARVLLVEDDALQANITKRILQRNGYEVFWAKDGLNAIKTIKTSELDIVLLDVVMPGMDGYEVCRWLKLEESTRGIPVIMLTAKKDLADKISGLQVGADDYLPKPYNELELNARIYASLRTKALQDELRKKNKQLERLLDKLEKMAITDPLTGLYNRRKFHDVLSGEFERTERYLTPCSLVLLDVDHFKKVNDSFGHLAGDAVLKELADILRSSVREVDTAARFGGEEFVLVLPNTTKEDAVFTAERIRERIGKHLFPEVYQTVTVSIGVSGIPDRELASEDALIRCADFALYRAKEKGRNRTHVAAGKELSKVLSVAE